MVLGGSVYAWFFMNEDAGIIDFIVPTFVYELDIQYWNKENSNTNKWENIPSNGINATYYPYFGEINSLSTLPNNNEIFLKIRMCDDENTLKYTYQILIKSLAINIYDSLLNLINDPELEDIDYVLGNPSQKCMNYYYELDINNLNPLNIFFGSSFQITGLEQSLMNNNFSTNDKWLYVKLELRLNELQNILRNIPISYIPYYLEFLIEIEGDARVGNNE